MSEWKEYKLEDFTTIHNETRIPLSKMERSKRQGKYPYYGASGIIDYLDDYLFDGEYVLISEDGENLKSRQTPIAFKANGQFWVNNHAHIVKGKKDFHNNLIIYYFKNLDLNPFITGAVQPKLNKANLLSIPLFLPEKEEEQKAIAEVLSSLDDKIDLLHRQNKTLEQMAETLFRQWFVEGAKEDWEEGTLGDVIDIFDNKRIPLSKMQRNKMKEGKLYPYYGAASVMDFVNDYIFDGEYILLGEDGTVRTDEGYPVLQYATGKFWVNNHTHIFQAKAPYNNFFIWNYLSKKNIDRIVTGAVQPKINQTNLKSLEFPTYPNKLVNEFIEITNSQFEKINKNKSQIHTLEKMRDTLLPKLMSGEVRVQSLRNETFVKQETINNPSSVGAKQKKN